MSDRGDTWIGYSARLRLGPASLAYASLLTSNAEGKANSRSSMRSCPEPVWTGDTVQWAHAPIDAAGTWRAIASPVSAHIFDSADGTIEWENVVPKAAASVRSGSLEFDGFGYAERLTMTCPPWRLGLARLGWGRFLSDSHSLVWIDWSGASDRRFVFLDSRPVEASRIGQSGVVTEHVELSLFDSTVLRTGKLGHTVLPAVIADRVPAAMLQIHETKWRSRGVLRDDVSTSEGWAIHEVVEWP